MSSRHSLGFTQTCSNEKRETGAPRPWTCPGPDIGLSVSRSNQTTRESLLDTFFDKRIYRANSNPNDKDARNVLPSHRVDVPRVVGTINAVRSVKIVASPCA